MSQIDLWYLSRATGVVALVLLTATVFLGVLVAGRARSALPSFARADIHRQVSALTVLFLAIHIVTALLDSYVHIGWFAILVPFSSSYERAGIAIGTVGTDLLLAVAISSVLRTRLPARLWRGFHWLAYLSWPSALSHTLAMGPDTRFTWSVCLVAACTGVVAAGTLWRLVAALKARSAYPVTVLSPRRSLRPVHTTGDAR